MRSCGPEKPTSPFKRGVGIKDRIAATAVGNQVRTDSNRQALREYECDVNALQTCMDNLDRALGWAHKSGNTTRVDELQSLHHETLLKLLAVTNRKPPPTSDHPTVVDMMSSILNPDRTNAGSVPTFIDVASAPGDSTQPCSTNYLTPCVPNGREGATQTRVTGATTAATESRVTEMSSDDEEDSSFDERLRMAIS